MVKLFYRRCVVWGMIWVAVPMATGMPLRLASQGLTDYVITVGSEASQAERHAAEELAFFLQAVTGAAFPVVEPDLAADHPRLAVGPDAARALPGLFDDDGLGEEGFTRQVRGRDVILSGTGGASRGTLYAVYAFLEDDIGCRWWTPEASSIPQRTELTVDAATVVQTPAFEYREAYIAHAVDGPWAARNRVNGHFYHIPSRLGGSITYRGPDGRWGFVHTFNTLVPPEKHFAQHPEWFSEIDGRRVGPPDRSQLCLANAEVLAFVIAEVRRTLRDAPPGMAIVSVSQNDWGFRCQCAACRAIEDEEGNPCGPLLRFVNAVADAVGEEFPDAVIDTLAYQYTRNPPKKTRPRPNVCVRLCDIEASFLQPLSHPANRAFAEDLRVWSEVCNRLYVWHYITNFSQPIHPFPNLRALGPDLRLFKERGVKGVFLEGGHYTLGACFSEIRAWVTAKLLWDPEQDADALVREFVAGYFAGAAPHVQRYIDRLHDEAVASNAFMPCSDTVSPFLSFELLLEADEILAQAEEVVAEQPEVRRRVQLLRAPIWHAIVSRWDWFRQSNRIAGTPEWFPRAFSEYVADYVRVCREHEVNPKHIEPWENPIDRRAPRPPTIVAGLADRDWLELSDAQFALYGVGRWTFREADDDASDGVTIRMPGATLEWATQCHLPAPWAGDDATERWEVYAAVAVEKPETAKTATGLAFSTGIYDTLQRRTVASTRVDLETIDQAGYHLYRIGATELRPECYVYVAPPGAGDRVTSVRVDRLILVRERVAPAQAP